MSSLAVEVKGEAMLASPNSTFMDTERQVNGMWASRYRTYKWQQLPAQHCTMVLWSARGFWRWRSSLALRLGSMLVMEIPTWACIVTRHVTYPEKEATGAVI